MCRRALPFRRGSLIFGAMPKPKPRGVPLSRIMERHGKAEPYRTSGAKPGDEKRREPLALAFMLSP